jgi:hypothetical protein
MTDPKVSKALSGALQAFTAYDGFDAVALNAKFETLFSSDDDFLKKVDSLDEIFNDNPKLEELHEVFFDLLMVNFFSEDVKKLEDDYLDTPEWEKIEEQTLDRGTELLNLLLYLNECEDEGIDPELDDYLKEFLLVDEDEFQDEYRIYEPVIANQILIESPAAEIAKVAGTLDDDSELKELFYPMICFFQNPEPDATEKKNIADNAVAPAFDMAVLAILTSFNS